MTSRPAAPPPAAVRPPQQQLGAAPPGPARSAPAPAAAPVGGDRFVPPPLSKLEDTGLSLNYLSDLALKIVYNSGYLTGFRIADLMTLPFVGIVDQILEFLKREKLVEVKGSGGFGEGAYQYAITGLGIERAREAMARNQYAGPTPVLIETYINAIRRQASKRIQVHQRAMRAALSNLVIGEKTFTRIGPAQAFLDMRRLPAMDREIMIDRLVEDVTAVAVHGGRDGIQRLAFYRIQPECDRLSAHGAPPNRTTIAYSIIHSNARGAAAGP